MRPLRDDLPSVPDGTEMSVAAPTRQTGIAVLLVRRSEGRIGAPAIRDGDGDAPSPTAESPGHTGAFVFVGGLALCGRFTRMARTYLRRIGGLTAG
jgi:hypothetical protein